MLLSSFGRGRATTLPTSTNRTLLSTGRGVDTTMSLGRGRGLALGRGGAIHSSVGRGGSGIFPIGRGRGAPISAQEEQEINEEVEESDEESDTHEEISVTLDQSQNIDTQSVVPNNNSVAGEGFNGYKPSVFGQALVYPLYVINPKEFVNTFFSELNELTDLFLKDQKKQSLPHEVKPFSFEEPSPDDLVLSKGKATTNKQMENEPFKPIIKHQAKQPKQAKQKQEIGKSEDEEPTTPTSSGTAKTFVKGKAFPPPDSDTKKRINVVIIGHVDAGKSTLMGHLLYQSGTIDDKIIHKYKRESQQIGKSSFHYAWVMDQNAEERQRGITMDIGVKHFDTEHKHVTILDAPGHRDFVPKMITGAVQADMAILVVGASTGEFEAGFKEGGQTREHLILVRSLGVSHILVAVNKMDMVEWSQERFNQIRTELLLFLKQIGLVDGKGESSSNIFFVPVSGLNGDNLVTRSPDKATWYDGPSLTELIDAYEPSRDELDQQKPVRISISDVYKSMHSGMTVSGKVESGMLTVNQTILLAPIKALCNVKSITRDGGHIVQAAYTGDNVEVGLTSNDFDLETTLSVGQILCDVDRPIPLTNRFLGRIIIFDLEIPLTNGSQCQLHLQHIEVAATISKIVCTLNRQLEVIKKKPRVLTKNNFAVVEITVIDNPICVELYSNYKSFGRFMLRMGNKTIAAGIVTELKKIKKDTKKSKTKTDAEPSSEPAKMSFPDVVEDNNGKE